MKYLIKFTYLLNTTLLFISDKLKHTKLNKEMKDKRHTLNKYRAKYE